MQAPYLRAWLSLRRVIDEIVADDAGNVFFFVRHVPVAVPFPVAESGAGPRRVVSRISPAGEVSVSHEGGFAELPSRARSRICWDLLHAHVDDFRNVTKLPCAVESEFADARLRADMLGKRTVILLRGDYVGRGEPCAAFGDS